MLFGASVVAERLLSNGDTAKGARVLSNVMSGLRELRGDRHPDTISCIASLAQALSRLPERGDEAVALAREAAASAVEALGTAHPDVSLTRATLAQVLMRRGELDEAEALMRADLEAVNGADAAASKVASLESQTAASNLAQVLIAQERLHEALPFAREALQASISVLGSAHEHTLDELGSLAPLLEAVGEADEAEATMRARLQTSRDVLGSSHPSTLVALSSLARFLAVQPPSSAASALDEAERLMLEDLQTSRAVHGPLAVATLAALSNITQLYYKAGRYAEALPLAREAATASAVVLDVAHKHRRQLQQLLAAIELEVQPAPDAEERRYSGLHLRPPPPSSHFDMSLMLLASWPPPGAAWAGPSMAAAF